MTRPFKTAPAGAVAGGMGGAQIDDTAVGLSAAGGPLVAAAGAVHLRRRVNRRS